MLVDIAGSSAIRSAIHHYLGTSLRHSIIVGATHQDVQPGAGKLPGPEPVPFFVPIWIGHRNRQWTPDGVRKRLGEAWRGFVAQMLDPARGWMAISSSTGPAAVARTYGEVLGGQARPDHGHVLSLSRDAAPM